MNRIKEFKEFVERYKPTKILFLSDEQKSYMVADPCIMELCFTSVLTYENPNIIYLTGGASSMRFNRVKFVEFPKESTPDSVRVKIYCLDSRQKSGESTYTIVLLQ